LERDPKSPTPVGHGWKIESVGGVDQMVVQWMDGEPAPEALLDLLACNCLSTTKCVCVANGLKCTDMCRQHSTEQCNKKEYQCASAVKNSAQNRPRTIGGKIAMYRFFLPTLEKYVRRIILADLICTYLQVQLHLFKNKQ